MDSCVRPEAEVGNSTSSPGLFTFSKGNTLGPRLATGMRQEMKGKGTRAGLLSKITNELYHDANIGLVIVY